MSQKQFLPVVAGPTASGKTGLAIALAHCWNAEVVSADSMQIYEKLCIGTARPSLAEMQGIPHHLQGGVPITQSYSVAQYVEDAHGVIADIVKRGQQPLLCGGTGLYISSLLNNVHFDDHPAEEGLRDSLRKLGGAALLDELHRVDPETAARLHENDIGRLVRACEVYRTTGITISEQARRSREKPSPYHACLLVLDFHDRQLLYNRIHQRVEAMLTDGLVEEARWLCSEHAPTAGQAIGYKEFSAYFAGECTLEETAEKIKQGTRRYAKRQLSWFRRMEQAHFLYVDEYDTPQALCAAAQTVCEDVRKEGEFA